MSPNNIKELLRLHGYTATRFCDKHLPHITRELLSQIISGKVLPTPSDMMVISEELNTLPTEMYEAEGIDLMRVDRIRRRRNGERQAPLFSMKKRQGNPEARVRIPLEELMQLRQDIADLGYEDYADWHADMCSKTHARNVRLKKRRESEE